MLSLACSHLLGFCTDARFYGLDGRLDGRNKHMSFPPLHHPHPPPASHSAATTLIFCNVGRSADAGTGWINVQDFIQAGLDRLVKEHAGALVSLVERNGEGGDLALRQVVQGLL